MINIIFIIVILQPIDERKELIERRKKVREVEDLRSTMIARIAETTKSTGTSAPTPSPVTVSLKIL